MCDNVRIAHESSRKMTTMTAMSALTRMKNLMAAEPVGNSILAGTLWVYGPVINKG